MEEFVKDICGSKKTKACIDYDPLYYLEGLEEQENPLHGVKFITEEDLNEDDDSTVIMFN